MIEPRYRWVLSDGRPTPELLQAGTTIGLGRAAVTVLAGRGIQRPDELAAFFAEPLVGLHDPSALPDAAIFVARVAAARRAGERVLVLGDFDADGLTGLAVVVRALARLGIAVTPYVPSRTDEGHGLSLAAVEAAATAGATVIVTVDCGTTSHREIAAARARGIDVLVTDHHRVPAVLPDATALVNPHRADSTYPDHRLTGAGVAFKVAQLVLAAEPGDAEAALELADLATIGTVSDLAPLVGENRSIARLGLERLRHGSRTGLAALLAQAKVAPERVDLETVAFAIAPRLNAAGRIGDALVAARLLLTDDPDEAAVLAAELEALNSARREQTRAAVDGARELAGADEAAAVVVRGPWPVGIVGLVASRLAEDTGRPAIVGAEVGDVVRASCRSGPGFDLAAALVSLDEILLRHGGHAGAAGFEVEAGRWPEVADRLIELAATAEIASGPVLDVDLALGAREIDYPLVRDLDRLGPFGPGHPDPLVAVAGLAVSRVRAANGGHTQVVLRRDPDVLDGIAFGRDDLATSLSEGDRVDVVARLVSRTFGGFESLQLEIRDVAPSGWLAVGAGPQGGSPTVAGPIATGAGGAG